MLKNLFKIDKTAKKKNKHLEFLCIADTHGLLIKDKKMEQEFLFERSHDSIDAILLLGDITKEEIRYIEECTYFLPLLGIKGNHDDVDQFNKTRVIDLNGTMENMKGVKIIGIEGSIKYKPSCIGFSQEESIKFAKSMDKKADILITHSHPWNAEDKKRDQYDSHTGLKGAKWYMDKYDTCNIYGHDHGTSMEKSEKQIKIYGIKRVIYHNGMLYFPQDDYGFDF